MGVAELFSGGVMKIRIFYVFMLFDVFNGREHSSGSQQPFDRWQSVCECTCYCSRSRTSDGVIGVVEMFDKVNASGQ